MVKGRRRTVYGRRMKRILLLLALAAAGAGTTSAQAPDTARIFAVNLYALAMDVQWGPWEVSGLFTRTVSKASRVPTGTAPARFRTHGQSAWSTLKGADGQPLALTLQAGAAYLLVVRANGSATLVPVAAGPTNTPKVLFVNAAKGPTALLRLGTAVAADGLEPGWTEFLDAVPGPQTLTWSWPTMPPGTEVYKAASAQPGQPAVVRLAEGRWYVAVVSSVYGQVTDITP
jgi:hypothetical protein